MRILQKLIFIALVFLSSGCIIMDSYDETLTVINNSTSRIYYTWEFGNDTTISNDSPQIKDIYWDNSLKKMIQVPDSLMKSPKYYEFVKSNCRSCKGYLEPGDTSVVGLTNIDFKQRVKEKGGFQIFFFNADLVELNDWKDITNKYLVLERQTFLFDELNKKKWQINYSKNNK